MQVRNQTSSGKLVFCFLPILPRLPRRENPSLFLIAAIGKTKPGTPGKPSTEMKVETYEEVETTNEAELMAHDAAATELIDRLGLQGQKAMQNPTTLTRCPYRQITPEENFVYRVLCPTISAPEAYNFGPIPLRVLQILAWAKEFGQFERLEIWSANSATVKDPVLVGYLPSLQNQWQKDCFILARWANELLPLEVMLPDAVKRYWERRRAGLVGIQRRVAAEIASMDESTPPPDFAIGNEPYFHS